jgi:hypothetical protein
MSSRFDLAFLKSTFLPSGGFAERHGAVKGAFFAAGAEALTARTAATIPLRRKCEHYRSDLLSLIAEVRIDLVRPHVHRDL